MKQSETPALESVFDSGYSTGLVSIHSGSNLQGASSIDHSITSDDPASQTRMRETRIDSGLCIDSDGCEVQSFDKIDSPQVRRFLPAAFLPDEEGDT